MNVPKAMSAVVFLSLVAQASADTPTPESVLANVAAKRAAYDSAKKAKDDAEQAARDYKVDLDKKFSDAGLTGPAPVPPPVNDPLTLKLTAAYKADPSATKASDLLDLVELMKQSQAIAADASLTSIAGVAGKVAAAMKTLVGVKLPGVVAVLKVEMGAAFPTDAPLTPELRANMEKVFAHFQAALTEAGK